MHMVTIEKTDFESEGARQRCRYRNYTADATEKKETGFLYCKDINYNLL